MGLVIVVDVVSVEAVATGVSTGGVTSLPDVDVTTVPSLGLCTTTTASFDSNSPKDNLTACEIRATSAGDGGLSLGGGGMSLGATGTLGGSAGGGGTVVGSKPQGQHFLAPHLHKMMLFPQAPER